MMRPAMLAVVLLASCARPDVPPLPAVERPNDDVEESPTVDDARVATIAAGFDAAMSTCPDRVWQGHTWNDDAIVLRRASDDRAWVWTGAGTIAAVDPSTLPFELRDFEFFSVGALDGARALAIDLDATEGDWGTYDDMALHLAIHEGFHFLGGQDDFTATDTGARDASLPLDWQPRFLRDRVLDALARAVGGDDEALGEARHWQDRLAAEHGDALDDARGLDVIEGTAQYVETVGVVVARLGCDASDDEIFAEVRAHADTLVFDDAFFDGGGESYLLGVAAGLLNRAAGQDFEAAARGTPLVDLALEGVAAADVDESAHEARRVECEEAIGAMNDEANEALAPMLAAWDDAASVHLGLPYGALVGAFGYSQGYYLSARDDDLHVLLDVDGTFALTGDASVSGAHVVEDDTTCGDVVFAVPVDPSSFTRAGDVVSGGAGALSVDALEVDEVVVDGKTWWCAR